MLRESLRNGCVVTRGLERFLLLYPLEAWQQLLTDLESKLPLTQPAARRLARHLIGGAATAVPDADGRVSIGAQQAAYAALSREVVLVGVGRHVELWDRGEWSRRLPEMLERASEDAEGLTCFLVEGGR